MNIFKYMLDYIQIEINKKTKNDITISGNIKYTYIDNDNIDFDIVFFIYSPGYPKIVKGFKYICTELNINDEIITQKMNTIIDDCSLYFNSIKDIENERN